MNETSVERLKRLRKQRIWKDAMKKEFATVDNDDLYWLIEQTERVQELEEQKEWFRRNIVDMKAVEVILRKENSRMLEVLPFYADSKNYEVNVVDQWGPKIKVMMDGGEKAAKLLGELK